MGSESLLLGIISNFLYTHFIFNLASRVKSLHGMESVQELAQPSGDQHSCHGIYLFAEPLDTLSMGQPEPQGAQGAAGVPKGFQQDP